MNGSPRSSSQPDTKTAAVFCVGTCAIFAFILLIMQLVNGDGVVGKVFGALVCAVALGLQGYFIVKIRRDWDRLDTRDRWKLVLVAIFVPFIVAAFSGIAIVGLIIAAVAAVFGHVSGFGFGRSSQSDSSTGATIYPT